MVRLWSEEYMSEESDDETYGPREPGKEKSKQRTTAETDSMSILAEGARLTCCGAGAGAATASSTTSDWLPDCCTGGAATAAATRGTVEAAPTWGSYTTTGDQTEKQAAAFAASVEQASREADNATTGDEQSRATKMTTDEEPLLADETPLSDDTTDAANVDFEEDASLEVTQDGVVPHSDENTSVAPFDEAESQAKAERRRTRTGFGLMMAGMFPRLGSGGSSKSKELLVGSSASGEEIARDLENTERLMKSAASSADSSTECTANGASPAAVAALAGAGAVAAAAVVSGRKGSDAPEDGEKVASRGLFSSASKDVEVASPVRSGVDPSVDGTTANASYGPGYSDLVPISNEKDLESGVGSTKGSVEDDSYEVDDDSEEVFIEKNPRGKACCYCCLCLLVLMILAGLGAFLGTGFLSPGFLKPENGNRDTTIDSVATGAITGTGETDELSETPGSTTTMTPPGEGPTIFPPEDGETVVPGSPDLQEGRVPVTFGILSDSPLDDPMALQQDLAEVEGASFLLHVGNVRDGDKMNCELQDYEAAASVLSTADVPVWVVPGPADWSLCDNPVQGENIFQDFFISFAADNWDIALPFRQPERPYNFAWEASDNVLVIGLNFLEEDRPGTVGEIFAWTRAVAQNFDGEQIVISSYSIPSEFVALVDTLELPNVLYVVGTDGEIVSVSSPFVRATDALTYFTVV